MNLGDVPLNQLAPPGMRSVASEPAVVADTKGAARDLTLLVYRQMRVLAGPHKDLEDLAQTVLEELLGADYQPQGKLHSFTFRVCYHVWLKHLRFSYRWRKRFVPQADENTAAEPLDPHTPGSLIEDRERVLRLYQALERVSPKRRAVVTLYYLSGLEVPEIASIVQAGAATVRTRLRDGKKKLRELLRDDPYFSAHFRDTPGASELAASSDATEEKA